MKENRWGAFLCNCSSTLDEDFEKLVGLVREREAEILRDIKEEYDRKKKKTGTSRQRFSGAKSSTDEKYHIVRYYAWRTSRNDKHHMYVNTLNIRKGDKIIYKIGYVINTGLNLTASQKSKFDKDLWIYIERKKTRTTLMKLGKKKIFTNNVLLLEIDSMGLLAKKEFLDINDMKQVKFIEDQTDVNYSKKSFVYDFLSSMRQKINDPLGIRAKKRKKINQQ